MILFRDVQTSDEFLKKKLCLLVHSYVLLQYSHAFTRMCVYLRLYVFTSLIDDVKNVYLHSLLQL